MRNAYIIPSILDIRYWTFNPWFVIRLPGMRRKVSIEFVGPVVIIEPLAKPQDGETIVDSPPLADWFILLRIEAAGEISGLSERQPGLQL